MDDPTWMADAEYLPDLEFDIGFAIQDCVYVGGDLGKLIPVPRPDLPLVESYFVRSRDVLGLEDRLEAHYRRLWKTHAQFGKGERASLNFRVTPMLVLNVVRKFYFPWHSKISETQKLVKCLDRRDNAVLFDDSDEGWAIQIIGKGHSMYFYETDGHDDPGPIAIHANGYTDRDRIRKQAKVSLDCTAEIIKTLASRLGQNYWDRAAP